VVVAKCVRSADSAIIQNRQNNAVILRETEPTEESPEILGSRIYKFTKKRIFTNSAFRFPNGVAGACPRPPVPPPLPLSFSEKVSGGGTKKSVSFLHTENGKQSADSAIL